MNNTKKSSRLNKLLNLLKSLKGRKPDYENLDFSKWAQTEEEYQKEQKKWIMTREKKEKDK